MSLLEEVYTAIYSEVDGSYPSTAPALNWYGPGVAPNDVTGPILMWDLIATVEWNALQLGTDYYCEYHIQFTAGSDKESPLQSMQVIEAVKTLFRNNNNSLTLSTGRVLDIDIGITTTLEAIPGVDGWTTSVDTVFEAGT